MEKTEHVGYTDAFGMSRIQQDLQSRQTNGATSEIDMIRAATAKAREISVGIVGAGFAGLRCADILLQADCKVTILEARDRLGGRVAQSTHLGHRVDLGPNWIHGTDDNPIMEIAKQTGTKLHACDEDFCLFDEDGKAVGKEEADEYSALFWDDGLIADAFRISNEQSDAIDPQKSIYDFFVERSQELFTDQPADVATRKRERLLKLTWMWSFYIGSPVTRQSLKHFWLEECIEGENPFVAGTYHDILRAITAPVKKEADILLNTEVIEISSINPKNRSASPDEVPNQPTAKTAKGAVHEFDELVVTTPLGWLKHNKTAFQPKLPARLSSAIDNISYGKLDKVYITFPRAFWETAGKTSPCPEFINWLQPTYAESTNPNRWMQEGVNLATLPDDCAHPTLLFYIQGPQSEHIGSLVESAKNEADRDAMLKEFFVPYYSLLPNYNQADPNCDPKAILATAWAIDKFAGYGSYSNYQVGLEDGGKDIEVMRHGMPERNIWLAGEHTAPFVASGTTTGAYWSGEAVGKRIANAYGLKLGEA